MKNLWDVLNSPFILTIIFPIAIALYEKFKNYGTRLKLKNNVIPVNVFSALKVNPIIFWMSCRKLDFDKFKLITKMHFRIAMMLLLAPSVLVIILLYKTTDIIINTPYGYASLIYTPTNEKFVMSENDAMSFSRGNRWYLNPDICHQDIYKNLASKNNISEELVYTVCSTVGFESKKNAINKRVEDFKNDRAYAVIMIVIYVLVLIWAFVVIYGLYTIPPKIINYKRKCLDDKYII
ncbi:DUF6216 family protein [Escherichia whittamii]|uniref:DUF6216 family protein n=1 Tax=Escherichia whittamii TaxID=2762229 RepID=UPI002DBC7A29|nr:DUF6216 family protein [Escherichia whittamii]MEB7936597.1 DUF6216 family protein [Escherichia whittamii]